MHATESLVVGVRGACVVGLVEGWLGAWVGPGLAAGAGVARLFTVAEQAVVAIAVGSGVVDAVVVLVAGVVGAAHAVAQRP